MPEGQRLHTAAKAIKVYSLVFEQSISCVKLIH